MVRGSSPEEVARSNYSPNPHLDIGVWARRLERSRVRPPRQRRGLRRSLTLWTPRERARRLCSSGLPSSLSTSCAPSRGHYRYRHPVCACLRLDSHPRPHPHPFTLTQVPPAGQSPILLAEIVSTGVGGVARQTLLNKLDLAMVPDSDDPLRLNKAFRLLAGREPQGGASAAAYGLPLKYAEGEEHQGGGMPFEPSSAPAPAPSLGTPRARSTCAAAAATGPP